MSVNFPLELIGVGDAPSSSAETVIRRIDVGTKFAELPITVDGLGNTITNPQEYWYRCGGGSTQTGNSIWYVNTGGSQVYEGKTTAFTPGNIPSYVPAVVQQTERYRQSGTNLEYTIPNLASESPLPSGTYRVNLIFSDNYRNFRVVNIFINNIFVGELREESTDGTTFVGEFQSYDVEVSNGVIEIRFEKVQENPKIHGIEIIKLGTTDETAFVTIGNINNTNDNTGFGSVPYVYEIAKYETFRRKIDDYNADPVNVNRQITAGDPRFTDDLHPAYSVFGNRAFRFVNWLNEREGYQPAYKILGGGSNDPISLWSSAEAWQLGGENRFRHKAAKYFLPSYNEWYKAAYYDPINTVYYDYATGSDTPPISTPGGKVEGTAVYNQDINTGLAVVTNAGGESPYGIVGGNGNVSEFLETAVGLVNDDPLENRISVGGTYSDTTIQPATATPPGASTTLFTVDDAITFRLARNPNAFFYTSYFEEFVPINNPGNDADTVNGGYGDVSYTYQIAKYSVAEEQIAAYNTANPSLQISIDSRGESKPATSVSWNEAARYVNWLNIREGFQPAYKFTTNGVNDNITLWSSAEAWQTDGENLYRHKDAKYFLPSEDEWYKAAYYDSQADVYYTYPTGSDTTPVKTAGSTITGEAVYDGQSGPADVTNAGGLSPYGTMGQGGNTYEWTENALDGTNDSTTELRGFRGGSWFSGSSGLQSSSRDGDFPFGGDIALGFRVACNVNANPISASLITIGDASNNPDGATSFGSVPYTYQIGKYEVNEKEIDEFNKINENAIFKFDDGEDKPARELTWNSAARFINWLNSKEGYFEAYSFASAGQFSDDWPLDQSWDLGGEVNRLRHKHAKYFLPSEDEWYKAAYWDQPLSKYWLYSTGSDTPPADVPGGVDPNTAVYNQTATASVIRAGGESPYGIVGGNGNVKEWLEGAPAGNTTQKWAAGESYEATTLGTKNSFPNLFLNNSGDDKIGFRCAANPDTKTPTILFDQFGDELVKYNGDIPPDYNDGNFLYPPVSILIGESASEIGGRAFRNNTNLESLNLGLSVGEIRGSAFEGCTNLTGPLNIPDSITAIRDLAFRNCSSLQSLDLGNTIAFIGDNAFDGCTNLTGPLNIPDTVFVIDPRAFLNCSGISSLKISNNMSILKIGTFQNCSGILGEVIIPDIVTEIGNNVFKNCSNVTSFNIPTGLESIGSSAFSQCSSWVGPLVLPDTLTTFGTFTFIGCSGLTSFNFPNNPNFTSIPSGLFNNCPNLAGPLIIPDSVTSIGNAPFRDCNKLTGPLIIPDKVTSIGGSAFIDCSGLESLTLGSGLTNIEVATFNRCSGMIGTLSIPATITEIGGNAFRACSFDRIEYYAVVKPSEDGNVFSSNNTTEIHVPSEAPFNARPNAWVGGEVWNGLTVVADLDNSLNTTLYDVNNLALISIDIDIPNNWNENETLFAADTIKIGSSCAAIGDQAFINNTSLTDIAYGIIPATVQTIGSGSFQNCTFLAGSLTISSGITSIGDFAFQNCSSITSVNIEATTAPIIGINTFSGMTSVFPAEIHVPTGATGYAASYNGLTVVADL